MADGARSDEITWWLEQMTTANSTKRTRFAMVAKLPIGPTATEIAYRQRILADLAVTIWKRWDLQPAQGRPGPQIARSRTAVALMTALGAPTRLRQQLRGTSSARRHHRTPRPDASCPLILRDRRHISRSVAATRRYLHERRAEEGPALPAWIIVYGPYIGALS